VRLPRIPNERWYVVSFFPQFKNEPACTNSPTPDDWFPEFPPAGNPRSRVGIRYEYSYTPEAMRARNTCLNCPAFDECLEYSLLWTDLTGIWANLDTYERREEQRLRNVKTTSITFSYSNPLDIDIKPRTHKESEWEDEL
jgi:hypothetical protein